MSDLPSDPQGRSDAAAELDEILLGLPEEQRRRLEITFMRSHSGPLPPPEVLREYGEVVPGLAEKIVDMAEAEQRHRHQLETEDLRSDRREASRGQYLGAGLMFLLVGSATALTLLGYPWVGVAFVTPAIFQAVARLIWRSRPARD